MPSRHREEGSGMTGTRQKSSFWWNSDQSPKPSPPASTNYACTGTFRSMDDFVTPGFSKLSAQGKIIVSPMSKYEDSWESSSTGPTFSKVVEGGVPKHPITYWGELRGGPWINPPESFAVPLPDYGRVYAEVATAAWASVKRPEFQGLVSLGELRETLSYLRNPFKTGLKIANTLDFRSAPIRAQMRNTSTESRKWKKLIKDLEDLYLEVRYGFRPLVKDVSDFLEASRDKMGFVRPERQTFRSGGSTSNTVTNTWTHNVSGITADAVDVATRTVTFKAGLLYEYTSGVSFPEQYGLELSQIPVTAWELVPLSFIADWVLNIGSYISAITPVAGMNQLGAWMSVTDVTEVKRSASNWKFSDWTTVSQGGGTDIARRTLKYRKAGLDLPSIVVKNKALSTISELSHVLDLTALIHQRLRKHP